MSSLTHGSDRALVVSFAVLLMACAPAPYPNSGLLGSIVAIFTIFLGLTIRLNKSLELGNYVPFLFILFAIISTSWSLVPRLTLQGGVEAALILLAILVSVRRMERDVILKAVVVAFRILLVASLLLAMAVPSVGLVDGDYQSGAVKGLFVHRNVFAFVAVLSIITFFLVSAQRKRLTKVFDLLLGAACLLLSQSQTSLVVTIAVAITYFFVWRAQVGRSRPVQTVSTLLSVAGAATLIWAVLANFSLVTEGLGRDDTLTGRTSIWAAVWERVEEEPLRGYGWDGVWHEGLSLTESIWSKIGFAVGHAHDGYLDLILQTGAVGMSLFALILFTALGAGWVLVLRDTRWSAAWPFTITIAVCLSNITESRFTSSLGIVVIGIAYFLACQGLRLLRSEDEIATSEYRVSDGNIQAERQT